MQLQGAEKPVSGVDTLCIHVFLNSVRPRISKSFKFHLITNEIPQFLMRVYLCCPDAFSWRFGDITTPFFMYGPSSHDSFRPFIIVISGDSASQCSSKFVVKTPEIYKGERDIVT